MVICTATGRMLGRLTLPTLVKRNAPRHLVLMALGMVSSPAAAVALCESSDENTPGIFDTLFPKDRDGGICWDKTTNQVTEAIFWDKLAKATGQKVC